jgi:hypothetical protein
MKNNNSLILNIAAFLKNTRMAGPGLRDVVWVQGCTIGCRAVPTKPICLTRLAYKCQWNG